MRKQFAIFFFLILCLVAQTARSQEISIDESTFSSSSVKDFGGFQLDMKAMNLNPAMQALRRQKLETDAITKNFSKIFSPDIKTYSTYGLYSLNNNSWGLTLSSSELMSMKTYHLNNGMQFNLYGQYGPDGKRLPQTSGLPWEKDQFKGAFELKSANGKFGIRVEMKAGHYHPF